MQKLKPFIQGDLDSLCGVYAVINAIKLCLKNEDIKIKSLSNSIFEKIIFQLEKRRKCAEIVTIGTDVPDLIKYVKYANIILEKKGYCLIATNPFYDKDLNMKQFLSKSKALLEQKMSGIILLTDGVYDHWTVLKKITESKMFFFDSFGISHFKLKSVVSCEEDTKSRHYLNIKETLLLKISKKEVE